MAVERRKQMATKIKAKERRARDRLVSAFKKKVPHPSKSHRFDDEMFLKGGRNYGYIS
jgi:hypothetical protein